MEQTKDMKKCVKCYILRPIDSFIGKREGGVEVKRCIICREYRAKYYKNNTEFRQKVRENAKKQYQYNKEHDKQKIREKDRKYYENNKEKMLENTKIWRENNKEKINEKITCECGIIVRKDGLTRHRKTQKHLKNSTI